MFKKIVRIAKYVMVVIALLSIGLGSLYFFNKKNRDRLEMERFQKLDPEQIQSIVLYRGDYYDKIGHPRLDLKDNSKISSIFDSIARYDSIVDPSHPNIKDSCFIKLYFGDNEVYTFFLFTTDKGGVYIVNRYMYYYSTKLSNFILDNSGRFIVPDSL